MTLEVDVESMPGLLLTMVKGLAGKVWTGRILILLADQRALEDEVGLQVLP